MAWHGMAWPHSHQSAPPSSVRACACVCVPELMPLIMYNFSLAYSCSYSYSYSLSLPICAVHSRRQFSIILIASVTLLKSLSVRCLRSDIYYTYNEWQHYVCECVGAVSIFSVAFSLSLSFYVFNEQQRCVLSE